MKKTFKVRITKKKMTGFQYSVGDEYTVTDFSPDHYCMAENHFYAGEIIYKSDCKIIVEDKMEEYTKDGQTWKLLRPITLKELILAGARDEDIEAVEDFTDEEDGVEACYLILEPNPLNKIIDYASSCNEKLQWLVDKGFVEKVAELKADRDMLKVRHQGSLKGRSFYLNPCYSWGFETDDVGTECLVPTLKR